MNRVRIYDLEERELYDSESDERTVAQFLNGHRELSESGELPVIVESAGLRWSGKIVAGTSSKPKKHKPPMWAVDPSRSKRPKRNRAQPTSQGIK